MSKLFTEQCNVKSLCRSYNVKEVSILWVPLSCDLVGCRPSVRQCLFKSFRKPFFRRARHALARMMLAAPSPFLIEWIQQVDPDPTKWSGISYNLEICLSVQFISWIFHRIRTLDSFAHKAGRVSTMPWPCHASRVGVELTRTFGTVIVLHYSDPTMIVFASCLLIELCEILWVALIMLYCSSSAVEWK